MLTPPYSGTPSRSERCPRYRGLTVAQGTREATALHHKAHERLLPYTTRHKRGYCLTPQGTREATALHHKAHERLLPYTTRHKRGYCPTLQGTREAIALHHKPCRHIQNALLNRKCTLVSVLRGSPSSQQSAGDTRSKLVVCIGIAAQMGDRNVND